jgi:hypothetical protein
MVSSLKQIRCRTPRIKTCVLVTLALAVLSSLDTTYAIALAKHSKLANLSTANLPMGFEPNEGQTDKRVDFVSRTGAYNLFLTHGSASLSLNRAVKANSAKSPPQIESVAVRMALEGADPRPGRAGSRLPGVSNYISGRDRSKWITGVPQFGRIVYHGVYPGVDLTYYGSSGRLEYDFSVAPNADPNKIALRFTGVQEQSLNSKGQLILNVAGRPLVWDKPASYQVIHGTKRIVDSRFVISGDTVKIALGAYDRKASLVIDPILLYGTYFPAATVDGMAVNAAGEVFLSGESGSLTFPTTAGVLSTTGGGLYLSRLTAGGSGLIYSTYLGFNAAENALAIDTANNCYIGGSISTETLPTTTGAFQSVPLSDSTGFLVEINSAGTAVNYATYIGGSNTDSVIKIATGAPYNVAVTGSTTSTDFPVTTGVLQTTYSGSSSTDFVAEFNISPALPGPETVYATYFGGSTGKDTPTGIGMDPATGNVYLTGTTTSTDFPLSSNAYQRSPGPNANGFISELNATGTAVLYSTYIPGAVPAGVTFLSASNVYIGGTVSVTFSTQPSGELGSLFVSDFDLAATSGSPIVFATAFGGNATYSVTDYAADANGVSYFTGMASNGVPVSGDALQPYNANFTTSVLQPFFGVLSSNGSLVTEMTYFGGADKISPIVISGDGSGGIYIAGNTSAPDMPTTFAALQQSPSIASFAFLDKFSLTATTGPQINYFSPTFAYTTDANKILSIFGAGFSAGTTVKLGTALASGVTVASANKLTVPLTALSLTLGSAIPITVTNPDKQFYGLNLQIFNPNPTITGINPNPLTTATIPQVVDISGQGFILGATVTVNGTQLPTASVVFVNSFELQATIPASYFSAPGTLTIVVTNPQPATSTATASVNVIAAPTPTLTSVSPTSVLQGTSGAVLTLTGTNFAPGSQIVYSGLTGSPFATTYGSSTTLTTVLPDIVSATPGTVSVQVSAPTGVAGGLSNSVNLTITPLTVTSFVVNPTSVVGGATVTGTITIGSVAPTNGVKITLSTNAASQPYLALPSTVTVPSGATSVTFSTIQTNAVFSGSLFAPITAAIGTSSQTVQLLITAQPGNTYAGGLQFFSVPYSYSALLSSIFVSPPTTGRIAEWSPTNFTYIYQGGGTTSPTAVTITPGHGYWGGFPASGTGLATLGTVASSPTTISLAQGWNSIGDPFTVPIYLSTLTFNNGAETFAQAVSPGFSIISPILYSYVPGAGGAKGFYSPLASSGSLSPGQGYWLYVYTPTNMTFTLPAAAAVTTVTNTSPVIATGGTTAGSTGSATTTVFKWRRLSRSK